ncbi:MAG: AMP-binding protein [Clostridia bacterium]|nr:AMP-binding protein [Clostridia bacterium]
MRYFFEDMKQFADTDRIAMVYGDTKLSYHDMWYGSEAIGAFLRTVKDDAPIIIWGNRENEVVMCFYGVIKGGHTYVFIPNSYPENRVQTILDDCGANTVISVCDMPFPIEKEGLTVISKQRFSEILKEYSNITLSSSGYRPLDKPWQIIYTSGSTGKPKGVLITGNNILAKFEITLKPTHQYYHPEGTKCLSAGSYAFSISLMTVYYDIGVVGATVYVFPPNVLTDYPTLYEFILKTSPNIFLGTPSFYEICLCDPRFSSEYLPDLYYLCVGGEMFSRSLYNRLRSRFPNSDIFNGYGSTEMASAPFMCKITDELLASSDSEVLPVGNTEYNNDAILVCDDDGNELPDKTVGELYVAGDCVSPGYLNRKELNDAVFFTYKDGRHGFKTRDLVVKDGNYIYYKGRKDNMVKIGGNRVELEDVEANLCKIDTVSLCVAVPVYENDTAVMLAAYIVLKDNSDRSYKAISHIKKEMSKLVQPYMVPQKIVFVDELMKNPNGKLDRKGYTEMSRI